MPLIDDDEFRRRGGEIDYGADGTVTRMRVPMHLQDHALQDRGRKHQQKAKSLGEELDEAIANVEAELRELRAFAPGSDKYAHRAERINALLRGARHLAQDAAGVHQSVTIRTFDGRTVEFTDARVIARAEYAARSTLASRRSCLGDAEYQRMFECERDALLRRIAHDARAAPRPPTAADLDRARAHADIARENYQARLSYMHKGL